VLKNYYEKIVEQLIYNADLSIPTFALFRTDRSDVLSRFLKQYCSGAEKEIVISSDMFKNLHSSYFPFLDLIKQGYSHLEKKQLQTKIKDLNIFYNHRELLYSYIIHGNALRKEDILEDELEYEKSAICYSILTVFFSLYQNKTVVLLLDNVNQLPHSTMSVLTKIAESSKFSGKVFICAIVDRDDTFNRSNEIINFIKISENKNRCIDIFFNEPKPSNYVRTVTEYSIDSKTALQVLKNSYTLLAYEDCKELISEIENNFYTNTDRNVSAKEIFSFHVLQGDVYTMLDNHDIAIIQYNTAMDLAINKNDNELIAYCNLKLSYSSFKKGDYESSVKFAQRAITMSEELDDKSILLKGLLYFFMSEDRSRHLDMNKWMEVFYRLTTLAKELNMINTLIFCYTNPFGMYSNYTEEIKSYHIQGIKLAKKRNDTYRLARAYHTRGMAYAVQGDYKNVFKYYKISRNYYKVLKDYKGLSYIYNGMGFYFYLTGSYHESLDCYFKALQYIRQFNDYHEVSMTLFNIALCFFMGFEDALSLKYLDNMLSLMNSMDYKNIAYHSEFGIRSLYGVVSLLSGDLVRAYQSYALIQSKKLKPYPKKNEEFFMYELLLALISKKEKNSRESLQHFKKAQYYLNRTNDVITYFSPRYFFELSTFYQEFNDNELYIETLYKGLEYAKKTANQFYELLFSKKLNIETEKKLLVLRDKGFDLVYWTQSAKLENNLLVLHKRINEINVLNRIQEYFVSSNNPDEIISKIIRVLNDNLSSENIFYYKKMNTGWLLHYSNSPDTIEISEKLPLLIEELSGRIITKRNNTFKEMEVFTSYVITPITVLNDYYGCFIFTSGDDNLTELSGNDLKVISIIMNQLSIALERKIWEHEILHKNTELEENNKKLLIAATTDKLTGLYNRQALYKKIEEEEDRMKRNGLEKLSVLFIDLDNFKFYNDTFGHSIGDKILIEFSMIMRKSVRSIDFISRYGGDEFIIILPDTESKVAEIVASRIIEGVINKNNFIDLLHQNSMVDVTIPDLKHLTASIGISSYCNGDDINSLVLKADKALYKAKGAGKGCYSQNE